MFLLRKEYKDVIGTVDRKGLFTGVKSKYFDDWNGTGEIGWMYVRDDLHDDGTITVFDFVRSKLTNGKSVSYRERLNVIMCLYFLYRIPTIC